MNQTKVIPIDIKTSIAFVRCVSIVTIFRKTKYICSGSSSVGSAHVRTNLSGIRKIDNQHFKRQAQDENDSTQSYLVLVDTTTCSYHL